LRAALRATTAWNSADSVALDAWGMPRELQRACTVSPGRAAASGDRRRPSCLITARHSDIALYLVHTSTANALLQVVKGHSSRHCSQAPVRAHDGRPRSQRGPRDVARALGKHSFVLRAVVAEFIGMTLFGGCGDLVRLGSNAQSARQVVSYIRTYGTCSGFEA